MRTHRPSFLRRIVRRQARLQLAMRCALFALATAAHAQTVGVIATDTGTATYAMNTSTITVPGFSMGAGNALVVVVNNEQQSSGTTSYTVTYDGTEITDKAYAAQSQQGAAVFYAISPSLTNTTGDVVVTFSGVSTGAVSVMSLSNVQDVGDTSTATGTSNSGLNLTYSGAAGGLVVAGGIDNRTTGTASLAGSNIDTDLQVLSATALGATAGIVQRYGSITSSGVDFVETFDPAGTGTSSRNAAALVAFTPIGFTGYFVDGVDELQVFQRTSRTGGIFGKGEGIIPIVISTGEPISDLTMRIRDAETSATVVDWQSVASSLDAGAVPLDLTIPAPDFARWYLLDFRPDGDDSRILTTPRCGMGEVTAAAGQSLAQDMFVKTANDADPTTITSLGLTISPYGSVCGHTGTLNASSVGIWALPTDASTPGSTPFDSAFAARYLERMVDVLDVPCALIGRGAGSSDIRAWLPPESPNNSGTTGSFYLYSALERIIDNAGGRFATFIWCQGHRSAINNYTQEQHTAYMVELFAALESDFPEVSFSRLIATIPDIKTTYANPAVMNDVRLAGQIYVQGDPDADLIDGLDLDLMPDLVHPDQAGHARFADHYARSALFKMGVLPAGARGPSILGATRTDDVLTLTLQHRTGTALVGSGDLTTQFAVYNRGTRTGGYGISSVTLQQPNKVLITLSTPPANTQDLDIWYRYPGDTSATWTPSIRDNTSDMVTPLGRQLALTNAAIEVASASTYAAWSLSIDWGTNDSSPSADPNLDGISNLLAYALNVDPLAFVPSDERPAVRLDDVTPDGPWFTYEYRQNTDAGDVTVAVQTSTDLTGDDWSPVVPDGTTIISEVADPDPDGDGGTTLQRIRIKLVDDRCFLRLAVSL